MKKTVIFSLGSNLGDRLAYLHNAQAGINSFIGEITLVSLVYESSSWGFTTEDSFLNQVIIAKTLLQPEEILSILSQIETDNGRIRDPNSGYASRTLDIDILYYDQLVYNTKAIVIPHPRMEFRKFVLVPLSEVAPDFVHPVLHKTSLTLLAECTDPNEVKIYTATKCL